MDGKNSGRAALPKGFALGALAAAALAGAIVPAAPAGLNLFICSLAIATAVAHARPVSLSVHSVGLGLSALSLALTPVFLSAGWVIALNLTLGIFLACWAVSGAQSWPQLVVGLISPVARLVTVPAAVANFFELGHKGAGRIAFSLLRGAVLAGGLLLVFGSLFASADAAFARLAKDLTPDLRLDHWTLVRLGIFGVVFSGTVALALSGRRFGTPLLSELAENAMDALAPASGTRRRLARTLKPVEWIPGLASLALLFASFVGVQVAVLFGGRDHVLRTAGLTYAQYAREGFAQLLLVSGLTLLFLAASNLASDRPRSRDAVLYTVLFAVICVFTLVVLASALHRLSLYEAAFGYTRARLTAHALLFWLAGVFLLVGALAATRRSAWLPLALVCFSAAAALGFATWNPDARIAEQNVQRYQDQGKLDRSYLAGLSADAVPALLSLPEDVGSPILESIGGRPDPSEPWTSWNLSRSRAKKVLGV